MGGGGNSNPLESMMGGGNKKSQSVSADGRPISPSRSDMSGPDGLDDLISAMNLEPEKMNDLDNISLMSGDTGNKNDGITLNL